MENIITKNHNKYGPLIKSFGGDVGEVRENVLVIKKRVGRGRFETKRCKYIPGLRQEIKKGEGA